MSAYTNGLIGEAMRQDQNLRRQYVSDPLTHLQVTLLQQWLDIAERNMAVAGVRWSVARGVLKSMTDQVLASPVPEHLIMALKEGKL